MEPNDDESGAAEFTSLHAFGWILLAFSLLIIAAGCLFALRPNLGEDLVSLGAISSAVFLLTSALLLGKYPAGDRLASAIGLRRTHLLLPVLGVLLGVVAQFPADRLRRVVERFFPLTDAQLEARSRLLESHSVAQALAIVVVAALLVPFAEEAFFRGAIFGALRRSGRGAVLAAWVTGLGFTFSHFDQRLWLPIAFVAALLGFVRAASGSLWPGLMLHIGFNGLTAVSAAFAIESSEEVVPLKFELAAWAALVVLLAAFAWVSTSASARAGRLADEVPGG
ncbi:MAG TPA: CPBP family intramembrane glutamic endopeptidase [Polyangiaceae bacterium]|nr:CPBP family intramembrane glutamic endopeptidase [Polyangiaceae bacterium]